MLFRSCFTRSFQYLLLNANTLICDGFWFHLRYHMLLFVYFCWLSTFRALHSFLLRLPPVGIKVFMVSLFYPGSPQLRPISSTATSAASSRSASPSLCSTGDLTIFLTFVLFNCLNCILYCQINRKWQPFFNQFAHTTHSNQNQHFSKVTRQLLSYRRTCALSTNTLSVLG